MVLDTTGKGQLQPFEAGPGVVGPHERRAQFDEGGRDVALERRRGGDARRCAGDEILAGGFEALLAIVDTDGHAQVPAWQGEEDAVGLEVEGADRADVLGPKVAGPDEGQQGRAMGGGIAIGIEVAVDGRVEGGSRIVRRRAEGFVEPGRLDPVRGHKPGSLPTSAQIGREVPSGEFTRDPDGAADAAGEAFVTARPQVVDEGIGDLLIGLARHRHEEGIVRRHEQDADVGHRLLDVGPVGVAKVAVQTETARKVLPARHEKAVPALVRQAPQALHLIGQIDFARAKVSRREAHAVLIAWDGVDRFIGSADRIERHEVARGRVGEAPVRAAQRAQVRIRGCATVGGAQLAAVVEFVSGEEAAVGPVETAAVRQESLLGPAVAGAANT